MTIINTKKESVSPIARIVQARFPLLLNFLTFPAGIGKIPKFLDSPQDKCVKTTTTTKRHSIGGASYMD